MAQNEADVFDPESMKQEYRVGGQVLVLRPMKVKSFKKFVKIIDNLSGKLKEAGEGGSASDIMDVVFEKLLDIMQLAFPEADFLTNDFIDDSMTVVQGKKLLEDVAKMNGLDQWIKDLSKTPGATPGA